MPTETEVANTATESTSVAAEEAALQASPSKTAPAAQSAKEPTMAEVARQAYEVSQAKHDAEESRSGQQLAQTEETEAVENEDETASAEEQVKEKEVEQEKEIEQAEEKETEEEEVKKVEKKVEAIDPNDPYAKLPFHKHPDFKKVIQEKNENAARVKALEPVVAQWNHHQQFMAQYGISQEAFANAMNILAYQQTDPAKARELLKPTWETLEAFDAEALPPDLQKRLDALSEKVETGEMTKGMATEIEQTIRENAKLRAAQKTNGARTQWSAQSQQAALLQNQAQALSDWSASKQATDLSFKPDSELHGLVASRLNHFCTQWINANNNPIVPAAVAVSLAERAYNDVKKILVAQRPTASKTKPNLSSSRSSQTTPRKKESEMSNKEIAQAVAKRHGIAYTPNGA